jgi:hypothetical protein
MSAGRIIQLLFAVCVLAWLAARQQSFGSTEQATSASGTPPPAVTEVYPKIGRQAPRGSAAVSVTRPDQLPAFTSKELTNFVQTHPVPKLVMVDPNPRVSKVDCTQNGKSVAALLRGKSTGIPDATSVCYVELRGRFSLSGPRSNGKPRGGDATFTTVFEVFDAKTGNLLLSGGFTRPPAAPQ